MVDSKTQKMLDTIGVHEHKVGVLKYVVSYPELKIETHVKKGEGYIHIDTLEVEETGRFLELSGTIERLEKLTSDEKYVGLAENAERTK